MATLRCVNRILLTGLFFYLTAVSSMKSDIIIDSVRDSRISLDNFATMLNVSFGASKCCNVLMFGESARTESLFDEFVRLYPYEYTLNNRIYECDNYLVISTSVLEVISAMGNIPTRMSTPKILIMVVDDVVESSRLFNASMYENAYVNIVALNGLWTLSENFLIPRIFTKVSSLSEKTRKQGIVNLQGQELLAMAYWNPPFIYLKSTVNRTVKGIEGEYFIPTNKSELDGIELKLFMLIAEQLNFSWTIRNPNINDRFGHEDDNKWVGGMMGQVINKKADFAFSSMWLTMDKYQYSNTTQPWTAAYIHFLVPRPKAYTSFWALTRPLSPEVWSLILAMIILQSIYVYTKAWVIPKTQKRFRSFTITWTELLGRLVGSWAPRRTQGLEMQFQLWHFISILVVTAYSCSLSSRLTNSHYEKRIDTLGDFIAANLTWSSEGETPNFSKIFDYSDPHAQQVIASYQELSLDDKHREILKRNYAVFGNIIGSNFYPKGTIRIEDFTDLRVMKNALAQFQTTFVVQPWLLQSVDTVLLRMKDAGLVQHHLKDVLHRRTGSILREVMVEHDEYVKYPKVLKLNPLGAGFAMLAIGLSISTVVFCLERRSVSRNRSFSDSISNEN